MIFIGFDPREAAAFAVCRHSVRQRLSRPIPVRGLVLDHLRAQGLYDRRTEYRDGRLWDVISEAPMSTEHAVARFLVPRLAQHGWALFMDGDILARGDLAKLFDAADPRYAVMCVKHHHEPTREAKMDGQAQQRYARKNWSSVCLWNVDHPANSRLTVETVNTVPGRDLHRFCWLEDDEIGGLDEAWNWLSFHSSPALDPALVHFTEGTPDMSGYEEQPYAAEWRQALTDWAA